MLGLGLRDWDQSYLGITVMVSDFGEMSFMRPRREDEEENCFGKVPGPERISTRSGNPFEV